jgi:hypothetical protein
LEAGGRGGIPLAPPLYVIVEADTEYLEGETMIMNLVHVLFDFWVIAFVGMVVFLFLGWRNR